MGVRNGVIRGKVTVVWGCVMVLLEARWGVGGGADIRMGYNGSKVPMIGCNRCTFVEQVNGDSVR